MGINGLLRVINPICQERHVQELSHTRVGVDVYGWLHKGAFSCALNLCRGIDTTQFVHFCMHRVRMLIHFNIVPILVFDGADLPMKADTHNERRDRREEAMRKAEEAFARGDRRKAEEWYQRAYTVTSEMARLVIRECRKINVQYIVAPYEADAQLAWMMKTGYIDGVITEDSDMIVYGAKKILFKMNRLGNGDLYESKNLLSLDSLNMNNFSEDMFMYMSVCSGCDFFRGVPGLGVKKSHAIVKRFRTIARIILAIRQDRRYKVQKSFAFDFTRACLVFRHQTVFDMHTSQHIHLNPFDDEARAKLPQGAFSTNEDGTIDLSFLGTHRDTEVAKQIAEALIHPRSLEKYMDPLDVVSRPISTRFRPRSFPGPQRKRRELARAVPKVGGFQVQPASAGITQNEGDKMVNDSELRYSASPNLRQRLTSRNSAAHTFNPRRIGATFRARHGRAVGSAGIWASFKSSREALQASEDSESLNKVDVQDGAMAASNTSTQRGSGSEDEQLTATVNRSERGNSRIEEARKNPSSRDVGVEGQEACELPMSQQPEYTSIVDPDEGEELNSDAREEPNPEIQEKPNGDERKKIDTDERRQTPEVPAILTSVPSPKRQRVTSSHRVEAVNRAISRFAQSRKKDQKKKFVAAESELPDLSGEKDECSFDKQLDKISPEQSMEGVDNKPCQKIQPQRLIKKANKEAQRPKQPSQLRLSRFFAPLENAKKGGNLKDSGVRLTSLLGAKNVGIKKHGIQKARKRVASSALSNFRRGAAGKVAVRPKGL